MPVSGKRFEYAVERARDGSLRAEGEAPLTLAEAWTPDHLLLAALTTCTIESLRFHAERASVAVVASAHASGAVTKREEDGRYAFVEVSCSLDVDLSPEPGADDVKELLFRAERDCFVGASLTVKPAYRWRVNGRDAALGEPDLSSRAEPS